MLFGSAHQGSSLVPHSCVIKWTASMSFQTNTAVTAFTSVLRSTSLRSIIGLLCGYFHMSIALDSVFGVFQTNMRKGRKLQIKSCGPQIVAKPALCGKITDELRHSKFLRNVAEPRVRVVMLAYMRRGELELPSSHHDVRLYKSWCRL